ncbi:hypothetical protein [Holdemania massiliensis]|uniref:hypothetical protein n=1 Tax=Holdemania massiliensis TaxID=1468449 RepID=UPI0011CA5EB9|nr:hypothetical protein [Holdemania massiliensis]
MDKLSTKLKSVASIQPYPQTSTPLRTYPFIYQWRKKSVKKDRDREKFPLIPGLIHFLISAFSSPIRLY